MTPDIAAYLARIGYQGPAQTIPGSLGSSPPEPFDDHGVTLSEPVGKGGESSLGRHSSNVDHVFDSDHNAIKWTV